MARWPNCWRTSRCGPRYLARWTSGGWRRARERCAGWPRSTSRCRRDRPIRRDVLALLDESARPPPWRWPARASSASSSAARCRLRSRRTGWPPPGTRTPRFDAVTPGRVARSRQVALRWLLELLGLPAGLRGAFVTGATMANFTRARRRPARGARARGLGRRGRRALRRAADHGRGRRGGASHAAQGARPARLGRNALVRVPVDGQGRMRADALPALSRPDDRLRAGRQRQHRRVRPVRRRSAARAREAGAWVHVDGAFGLWARGGAGARAPASTGSSRADSWATDAHKWLNVPYDSGLAFVRDAGALRAAMAITAAYLPPASARATRRTTRPSCRAARAASRSGRRCARSGASGAGRLVERSCRHARRFAEGLAAAGYEVLQRRGAEPGAGLVRRRPRRTERVIARHAGRRHLLVRRHRLAGPDRDAHQRLVLGDDGRRRRAQPGGDAARGGRADKSAADSRTARVLRRLSGPDSPNYFGGAGGGPTVISSMSNISTWPASSPLSP